VAIKKISTENQEFCEHENGIEFSL